MPVVSRQKVLDEIQLEMEASMNFYDPETVRDVCNSIRARVTELPVADDRDLFPRVITHPVFKKMREALAKLCRTVRGYARQEVLRSVLFKIVREAEETIYGCCKKV